ncbi:MAG TPA: Rieske 2Fe-2S domain-containing protein [Rugosibacter sp.]
MSWEAICLVSALPVNEIQEFVTSHGSPVIVVRNTLDEIKVYQGLCPHQRRSLVDGYLSNNQLTCAAHMWQFDLQNGKGINGTDYNLASYPIKTDGDQLLIEAFSVEVNSLW